MVGVHRVSNCLQIGSLYPSSRGLCENKKASQGLTFQPGDWAWDITKLLAQHAWYAGLYSQHNTTKNGQGLK